MSEHTFHTPEPVQLYVENGSGHIDVASAEVAKTEVRIEGQHADQVEVVHDRDQVSVIAPKSRGILGDQKLDMDIVVPTGSSLIVKSGSADVRASGQRMAKIKSGSGDVSLERLTGAGSIDTGSGDVALTVAEGELRVRSGSGDFVASRAGRGDHGLQWLRRHRLERAAGRVVVKTGSGDLEIDEAENDVT